MSYYWFNGQELLQEAKDKYHNCGRKEKAAEHYIKNKYVTKQKANNKYKNLSEEEKEAKREYGKTRYKKMKEKSSQFLQNIKISYYWFDRGKILKDVKDKYHNKRGKKKLLSIILLIEKF